MPAAVADCRPSLTRRIASLLAATMLGVLATACPNGEGEATHPPPEVYGGKTRFVGEWHGEVGDVIGTLKIDKMGDHRYYASFRGEDRPVRYILDLDQLQGTIPGDGTAPSNLCLFTWQDGRGGRGEGWLLINRERTALTGTFGRGESTTGMGLLTFIRDRDDASTSDESGSDDGEGEGEDSDEGGS